MLHHLWYLLLHLLAMTHFSPHIKKAICVTVLLWIDANTTWKRIFYFLDILDINILHWYLFFLAGGFIMIQLKLYLNRVIFIITIMWAFVDGFLFLFCIFFFIQAYTFCPVGYMLKTFLLCSHAKVSGRYVQKYLNV